MRRIREAEKPQRVAALRGKETTTMAAAARVSVDKPLTEKQKLFVKYWAEGDNIPNAMQRAGYNEQPSYGLRMAKMPNVLALKQKYHDEFIAASRMTKEKVMDMLKESYDMAKLMSEPASMVSAAREIGKLCGYYEPKKVEINVNHAGQAQIQRLTDAELFEMIEKASSSTELLEDLSDNP